VKGTTLANGNRNASSNVLLVVVLVCIGLCLFWRLLWWLFLNPLVIFGMVAAVVAAVVLLSYRTARSLGDVFSDVVHGRPAMRYFPDASLELVTHFQSPVTHIGLYERKVEYVRGNIHLDRADEHGVDGPVRADMSSRTTIPIRCITQDSIRRSGLFSKVTLVTAGGSSTFSLRSNDADTLKAWLDEKRGLN
jgi:hypothetical protein